MYIRADKDEYEVETQVSKNGVYVFTCPLCGETMRCYLAARTDQMFAEHMNRYHNEPRGH